MALNPKNIKTMFLGTFEVHMDKKHRIVIPSKWKKYFETEMVIKKGYDNTLAIRTYKDFEEFSKNIINSKNTSNNRIIKRLSLGGAHTLMIDSWFRFILPTTFIKETYIEQTIYLVGCGDFIELWGTAEYDDWKLKNEDKLESMEIESNEK